MDSIETNQSTCSLITSNEDFRSLEVQWNRLAVGNPFLTWDWMFSWWEVFGRGNQLLIFVVRDASGNIEGILPLFKTVTSAGTRVLRCLGSGAACSDYMSVICQDSERERIETVIARTLVNSKAAKRSIARWDILDLEGHSNESFNALINYLASSGCPTHRQEIDGCWITELEDSFEKFEMRLRKSFRRKTKKAKKNLVDPAVEFKVYETEADLQRVWSRFCELHQRRRETLGQPGCFADPLFERFLLNATRKLIRKGQAKLAHATVEGKDLGFVLVFATKNRYWKYQSGQSPELNKWEPGYLVTTGLIKEAIANGIGSYDFLRGDEPYKRFWDTTRVPLYRSRIAAPTVSARMRHRIWLVGKTVKNQLSLIKSNQSVTGTGISSS